MIGTKLMSGVPSSSLVALEMLIFKTGRGWKTQMRALKSLPLSENDYSKFSLNLKGMTEAEIHDLSVVSDRFVKQATRPAIFDELKRRRAAGLKI